MFCVSCFFNILAHIFCFPILLFFFLCSKLTDDALHEITTLFKRAGIATIGARRKLLRLIQQSHQIKKHEGASSGSGPSTAANGQVHTVKERERIIFDSPSRTALLLKTIAGSSGSAGGAATVGGSRGGLHAEVPAVNRCPQCGQPHSQPALNLHQPMPDMPP